MQKALKPYKRYCKTLKLVDDPQLIEAYKAVHAPGAAWPEITAGMKAVGILDMEIYLHGNVLFMIMDTVPDFEHERAMAALSKMSRQAEWEAFVSKFQHSEPNSAAKDKWQLMERIYELDQQEVFLAENGQVKV
ncbi:L-rhamnose mutarotase [Catalinimonas alkaloidigena]|uniref:L-rhamnose mutarotase n=1 Tax=Catalinimonas alkaloidigena TaxID=1075417 RepID=UPI00240608E7|nr:L-rhamnose mutarotase [Catalinimonas alkaloidigena]MDF9796479.1 L-rhamnose mutarotase [Catalinimonas alkaloidigena]